MTDTTVAPPAAEAVPRIGRQRRPLAAPPPAAAPGRPSPRTALARRLEPWRDCVLIGLLNHAVLLAVALLRPGVGGLLLGALALSAGFATGTLTVLHDAGHRMYGKREWPNVLAVQLGVPAGLWVGHWTLKHRVHHKLTQVYPLDEATRSSAVLRLHPGAQLRPMHRFQHLYAWPLYSLAWAGELRSQLTYLRTGVVTGADTPPTGARLRSFAVEKTLWLLVLAPYAWALGLGRLAVLLLLAEFGASLIAAVITVVGHVNVGLEPPLAPPGKEWATYLVRTTASFQTGSTMVRWWTGGLTHHLAHHLRPVALRSELPALHDTTVRDVVAASGSALSEYPTLGAAIAAHARRLRELGQPEAACTAGAGGAAADVPRHAPPLPRR